MRPEHDIACSSRAPKPQPRNHANGPARTREKEDAFRQGEGGRQGRRRRAVPHPRPRVRTYLGLDDLQVAHLDATGGEVGDLELDLDRPLALGRGRDAAHAAAEAAHHAAALVVVAAHRRQPQLRTHQELLAAAELLDLPHD